LSYIGIFCLSTQPYN